MYDHIVKAFGDWNVPYKENMIGFAADGANVMMGSRNSIMTHLRKDIPNLFVMKCICHSFHLCASYACEKLPRAVEDEVRDIYNYFHSSPKRQERLKDFQGFLDSKPHKMLQASQTRWLSLHSVVGRVLEQYEPLKRFFAEETVTSRLLAPQTILQRLQDPLIRMYLEFLEFVLPIFTKLYKQMQSEFPQIHNLRKTVGESLRTIHDCYLKSSYLKSTPIEDVEYRNPSHFLKLEEVYLGAKTTCSLLRDNDVPVQHLEGFRLRCLDFFHRKCPPDTVKIFVQGRSSQAP
ncbi:hypothetical protein MTO96_045565 [Rhipicephalus appendiculatus]